MGPLLIGRRAACVALAAAGRMGRAAAPMRLVVAYPPGGISDAVARSLAAHLDDATQVYNQPGAGGAIALRTLARAAPDGRTLVFSAITPVALDAGLARTVVPVAAVMSTPSLLVATPAYRGTDFDSVVNQARSRPGSLRWATSGIATTGHLILQQVCRQFGLEVTHVPYKGGGQQLADALAGQFELLATNVASLQLGFVHEGRLRALAVGAPARLGVLPRVPTLAELGCASANLASVFGVFAPPGTPAAVVRRLNAAIGAALGDPDLGTTLLASGNQPIGGNPAVFAEEISRLAANLRQIAR